MAEATTEAVMQHHEEALLSGNLDELAKDYAEDSVLFTPTETYKGPESIKAAFAAMMSMLAPEALVNFKVNKQHIQGEYVYLLWTAAPTFPFTGDTFHIHNGKIMMQSVVFASGR
ncbi:nuclear transport factor 2 family protein [Chloroflexota bacterium]